MEKECGVDIKSSMYETNLEIVKMLLDNMLDFKELSPLCWM